MSSPASVGGPWVFRGTPGTPEHEAWKQKTLQYAIYATSISSPRYNAWISNPNFVATAFHLMKWEQIWDNFMELLVPEPGSRVLCHESCACKHVKPFVPQLTARKVNKVVCFGLGTFKYVSKGNDYRALVKTPLFRAKPYERNGELQVLLRHVAAMHIAAEIQFGGNMAESQMVNRW